MKTLAFIPKQPKKSKAVHSHVCTHCCADAVFSHQWQPFLEIHVIFIDPLRANTFDGELLMTAFAADFDNQHTSRTSRQTVPFPRSKNRAGIQEMIRSKLFKFK